MQLGDAVGPIGDSGSSHEESSHEVSDSSHEVSDSEEQSASDSQGAAAGTQRSAGGLTLTTSDTTLPASERVSFDFRIESERGIAVRSFELNHTKRMHLVLVRRDMTGFQHLHPVMDGAGTWSVPVGPLEPGSYRAFADFIPAGAENESVYDDGHDHGDTEAVSTVLAVDIDVPGLFKPRPLPEAALTAATGPYTVEMTGGLQAGTDSVFGLTIRRNGRPVEDLQPYLGAPAHLVVLRAGDLAYLHVHPLAATAPGEVMFSAAVPSPGDYRMFLGFMHRDVLQRAEITANVPYVEFEHGHN